MTDISNIIDIETEPLSTKTEADGPSLYDKSGFRQNYGIEIGGPQTYIQK